MLAVRSTHGSAFSFRVRNRLNILYNPLEVIDDKALADACQYKWYNQTHCKVNDSVFAWASSRASITGTSTTRTTSFSTS
jgi:hypothetical protein